MFFRLMSEVRRDLMENIEKEMKMLRPSQVWINWSGWGSASRLTIALPLLHEEFLFPDKQKKVEIYWNEYICKNFVLFIYDKWQPVLNHFREGNADWWQGDIRGSTPSTASSTDVNDHTLIDNIRLTWPSIGMKKSEMEQKVRKDLRSSN